MQAVATALRAFGKRLVVRRDPPETQSQGGVILPDSDNNRSASGTVVSVGPLVNKDVAEDFSIEPEAHIFFHQYAGQQVTCDGEEYLIISADDVLAIIE